MAYRMSFKGLFAFDTAAVLERLLDDLGSDGLVDVATALQQARRGPLALVLAHEAYQPASAWDSWCAALDEVAARARCGRLVATFVGDARQVEVFEAVLARRTPLPAPLAGAAQRGGDPMPVVDGARYTYRLMGQSSSQSFTWCVRTAPSAFGTAFSFGSPADDGVGRFNDWLGASWWVRRDSQLLEVGRTTLAATAAGLAQDCTVFVDLADAPGTARVSHAVGQELARLVVVEPPDAVSVPAGTFADCLVLRVEEHWLEEDPTRIEAQHQWWAPGVGLVRLRSATGAELALEAVEGLGPRSEDEHRGGARRAWWRFW